MATPTQISGNGGILPPELAAVDALAQAVATAVRVLNEHVDVALAETLNYLTSAQADLDKLNNRLGQIRAELTATRDQWRRTAAPTPPPTTAQSKAKLAGMGVNPGPAPAFLQKPVPAAED